MPLHRVAVKHNPLVAAKPLVDVPNPLAVAKHPRVAVPLNRHVAAKSLARLAAKPLQHVAAKSLARLAAKPLRHVAAKSLLLAVTPLRRVAAARKRADCWPTCSLAKRARAVNRLAVAKPLAAKPLRLAAAKSLLLAAKPLRHVAAKSLPPAVATAAATRLAAAAPRAEDC